MNLTTIEFRPLKSCIRGEMVGKGTPLSRLVLDGQPCIVAIQHMPDDRQTRFGSASSQRDRNVRSGAEYAPAQSLPHCPGKQGAILAVLLPGDPDPALQRRVLDGIEQQVGKDAAQFELVSFR